MDIPAVTEHNYKRLFRVPTNRLIAFLVLLFASNLIGLEFYPASAQDQPIACNAIAILREAARIADQQENAQAYWCDRLVARIVDLQIRSLDLEGALRTNRNCEYQYAKRGAFIKLAEAYAQTGKYEKAIELVRELGTDHGWRQDWIEDGVRLHWIDYLIENGDLDRARSEIEETVAAKSLPEGLCKLAIELSKSGKQTEAKKCLRLAVDKSLEIPEEFDRAKSLWEIARIQTSIGESESADATILILKRASNDFKDPSAQTGALREAAVSAAKNGNLPKAIALFNQAIEARSRVNELNKMNSLNQIAKAQASVNLFDEAFKTAQMMNNRDASYHDDAICAIAIAQAEANAIDDAIKTSLSIVNGSQYQDGALFAITEHCLDTEKTERALKTAAQISHSTRKATALLKVASAYASLGDMKTARTIAGQIQLEATPVFRLLQDEERVAFDFAKAETWGVVYDASFTSSSRFLAIERAGELAAAAIVLSQRLSQQDSANYAEAFKDMSGEVVRALAQSQAEIGDAKKALAWASRIGSKKKITPDDDDIRSSVEQRIYALIGVAEGLLELRGAKPPANAR